MSIKQNIIEIILEKGTITVAEYMEICIPYYYANNNPFGKDGDFITAPEISQIFGEIIGAWLLNQWYNLGQPTAILCEAGPGRGTLMQDILRVTAKSDFHNQIEICLIENSQKLRELQKQNINHGKISWHNSFASIPNKPLFLVANEFFDAMPIEQYLENGEKRKITYIDGQLKFIPKGEVVAEESPVSSMIMEQICNHIKQFGGVAIIIDYGYAEKQYGATLQALKKHEFVLPLEFIGEADITALVNFKSLIEIAQNIGLKTTYTTQGEFLRGAGAELRAITLCKNASDSTRENILSGLERLVSPQKMGELFKVLTISN